MLGMPGAVASASGQQQQCVRPSTVTPQTTSIRPQQARNAAAPAVNSHRSSPHGHRLQHITTAAAAAGSSDSCSTSYGTSSSSRQQGKQQRAWQEVQLPPAQTGSSMVNNNTPTSSSSSSSRDDNGVSRGVTYNNNVARSSQPAQAADGKQTRSRQQTNSSSNKGSRQLELRGDQQLTGAAIMQQLKAAGSWQQLEQLVQQHGTHLNWRHSCALITHLAQVAAHQHQEQEQQQQQHHPARQKQQQDRTAQAHAAGSSEPQQQQQGTTQVCQSTSSRQPDPAELPSRTTDTGLQQFVQASLMPLIDSHMQSYDARGLANCLWSMAKLRAVVQPSATWLQRFYSTSQPLLQQFDAQQLSNSLWGLVQLQQVPPAGWMQDWYASMLQACPADDVSWQPQSVSSALWSLAHMHGSSGSGSGSGSSSGQRRSSSSSSSGSSRLSAGPSSIWVDALLQAAMQRVVAGLTSSGSSSSSRRHSSHQGSSGQVVSNTLWACVQLQHQPSLQVLRAVSSWLQQQVAAAEASPAAPPGGSSRHQQQQQPAMGDQSLANCLWALGKLRQQQQSSSPQHRRLLVECGRLLLQLSGPRLASSSNQHLSNMVWGAGALQLQVEPAVITAVMQQLVTRAGSLTDQQVANLLWGLSHIKQPQQPQQHREGMKVQADVQDSQLQQPLVQQPDEQQQQQQQHNAACIEQLLSAQVDQLQSFSSQAIGSTLLSLVRLQHVPSEDTLQAWLQALGRRTVSSSMDVSAVVDACCALALLRRRQQQQQQQGATGLAGSNRGIRQQQRSLMLGSPSSSRDSQWLQDVCAATLARLGSAFTADQLCALGWAMTALRFRAPVPWLTAWQVAVADRASTMDAATAARALSLLQDLPGSAALGAVTLHAARLQLADAAVAAAITTAATAGAGKSAARDAAAAAACIAATRGSRAPAQGMPRLLQVLPGVVPSCSPKQLATLLSAAAAMQAPLQPGLLPDILQQAQRLQQQQQQQQQPSATSWSHLLAAVAKVSKQQQQHCHASTLPAHQQQQQQLVQPEVTGAPPQQQQQQQLQQEHQQQWQHQLLQEQQQQQQPTVSVSDAQHEQQLILQWLQHCVPLLPLQHAPAAETSMLLWSLAVLCYHPGRSWLDAWMQHSKPLLQAMSPQQLASCGWALTVLRHRPDTQWLSVWTQCVAQKAASAAATAPSSLALLLYSSATLGCPVNTAWLRSVAAEVARHAAAAWSPADVADGLWGLAHLGLRAVAEEEVLELLLDRLVKATAAAGQLQGLGPHRQLQVLQAAVLLGPGAEGLQQQQQQDQQQHQHHYKRHLRYRNARHRQKLRWLNFRAYSSSAAARQAVAGVQQQLGGSSSSSSSSDGASSSSGAVSRSTLAAIMGKAAVVSARYVAARTGQHPAAVGAAGPIKPSWFAYWCRVSLQTVPQWRPQQIAAALAAFAALQWQPPLVWQQQMLAQAVGQQHQGGGLSVQTATAIQDALVALQSPLVKTWRRNPAGESLLQYIPSPSPSPPAAATTAAAAATTSSTAGAQPQQVALPLTVNRTQQQQQQQGLRHVAGRAERCPPGSEPRQPHHLRGNAMRRLCSKQRLMKLVGWWRQQQVMQQQYAQQRQQQQELEEQWRAAAAGTNGGDPYYNQAISSGGSSSSSSRSGYSSLSSSASVSPRSSVDGGSALPVSPGSSSSSSRPVQQPCTLDSSVWGRQLLRPPARPASLASSSVDGGGGSSSGGGSGTVSNCESSVQISKGTAGDGDGDGHVDKQPAMAATQAAEPDKLSSSDGTAPSATGVNSAGASAAWSVNGQHPVGPVTAAASTSNAAGVQPAGGSGPDMTAGVVQVVQAAAAAVRLPGATFDTWAAVGSVSQQLAVGDDGVVMMVRGADRQVGLQQPGAW